jgi:hypothetical protein
MPRRRARPRPAPRLFTIDRAARRIGVAKGTFRKHVLPRLDGAQKIGRRWLITAAMLDAFIADIPAWARRFLAGYLAGRKLPPSTKGD